MGNDTYFTHPIPENLLTLYASSKNEAVITVKSDGRVFWGTREIRTDEEFVKTVKVIVERLFGGPPYGKRTEVD